MACEFDAIQSMDAQLEEWPVCKICGSSMAWEDCGECDDGFIDLYDEDPIFYDEDETEVCEMCKGNGGWWFCPNAKNHTLPLFESEGSEV